MGEQQPDNESISIRKIGDYFYMRNDENKTVKFDTSQKYFSKLRNDLNFENKEQISVNWKLNEGFNRRKSIFPYHDDGIRELLKFILSLATSSEETNLKKVLRGAKIVCNRHFLREIASETNWKFAIEKYKGILFVKFISKRKSHFVVKKVENTKFPKWKVDSIYNPNEKSLYRGYNFENYLNSPIELDRPGMSYTFGNTFSKSVFVFNYKKNLSVFYAAQIDGLSGNDESYEGKSNETYDRDLTWLQCHLSMTKNVIFGNSVKGNVSLITKTSRNFNTNEENKNVILWKLISQLKKIVRESEEMEMKENELLIVTSENFGVQINKKVKNDKNKILDEYFKHHFRETMDEK